MADPNELVYVELNDTKVRTHVGRSYVDRWPDEVTVLDEPAPDVDPEEPAPAAEDATPASDGRSDASTSSLNLAR